MKFAAVIPGLLVTCALTACSQKKPLNQSNGDGAIASKAFAILEQSPAQGSIRADEVFAAEHSVSPFAVVNQEGRIVDHFEVGRAESSKFDATFSRDQGIARTEFLRFNDNGDLVVTAIIDHKENAISHFDPPLLVMPAELFADQSRKHEVAMRVVDANDPKKVRESGRASRTITYIANQRVRTHDGDFDAKRIESRFQADLKLADVDELTVMFVRPGAGIIAEQSTEQVKILGAFGNTTKRTIVRVKP
jgi:hypothetical protein